MVHAEARRKKRDAEGRCAQAHAQQFDRDWKAGLPHFLSLRLFFLLCVSA